MPANSPLGPHVLDSGPLFCLGASNVIADLYDDHYLTHATVVEAVRTEIDRKAGITVPPGDPYRTADIKRAAQKARGRYSPLLAAAIARPAPVPEALEAIEADLFRLAQIKARRRGTEVHPSANRGEAESLHIAELQNAILIANDTDANLVTGNRGKTTSETFVDVVRRLNHERHDITARQLLKELQKLQQCDIGTGEHVNGVTDIV